MNNTKAKPSTSEGWAIHIYDSDRYLRFSLDSSHIWAFSWGIGLGIGVAILWSTLSGVSHNSTNTNQSKNLLLPSEKDSRESLGNDSDLSFPFGID